MSILNHCNAFIIQDFWLTDHIDLLRIGEPVQHDFCRAPSSQGCKHLSVMPSLQIPLLECNATLYLFSIYPFCCKDCHRFTSTLLEIRNQTRLEDNLIPGLILILQRGFQHLKQLSVCNSIHSEEIW